MTDLIKRNYRRRMSWYVIGILGSVASIVFFLFAITTQMPAIVQNLAFFAMLAVVALPAKVISNAYCPTYPWVIKKVQLGAIKELKDANFEEIEENIHLWEYFKS